MVVATSGNLFKGTLSQLLAVLSGALVAISDGMHFGWTAPVLPILMGPDSPVAVTKEQGEWLETVVMIGAFSGLWGTMYLVDKIGRKRSILLATVLSVGIWVTIALAPRVEYILVARFLSGAVGNMAFVATPMYIAEIAEQKIRGFLSSLIYVMMLLGIFIIYCAAPFVPIYVHCSIGAILTIIELLTFSFMPESPYYLIYKNQFDEARKSLERLRRGGSDIDKELEEIKVAVERQKTEKGKIQNLFSVPSNRKAITIIGYLNMAQHFSSISVLIMNLHSVLEAAGSVYMEPATAAILFALLMLLSVSGASFLMDRFGRRILLILSSIAAGICLLSLSIYFSLKHSGFDMSVVSWIPIVCVMLYAVCFKSGLGIVPIVLTAELFPAKMKAYGMTLADGMYVVGGFLSLLAYQRIADVLGIEYPFYLFSFICFFTSIFTYFFIPETKGKSLEQIQMILKGKHPDNTEM